MTEQATGGTIEDEHIPPEFFEEPTSTTAEEGGCAKFVCDVDGEPIPSGKLCISQVTSQSIYCLFFVFVFVFFVWLFFHVDVMCDVFQENFKRSSYFVDI